MFSFLSKLGIGSKRKPLYLSNTLTDRKEQFIPISSKNITVYTCGPTVYDRAHIGNLRAYVFADILRKTLVSSGYRVKYVINITDVGHLTDDADLGEDKVEKAAKSAGMKVRDVVDKMTGYFFSDLDSLRIEKKEYIFPKATDYINEQIEMIKKLEALGYTYKITDGVYYDTSKFNRYGLLGRIRFTDRKTIGRIKENREKRNPSDFCLWRFPKEGEKRQQEWDSPFGVGFPGWSIECSAMALNLLGEKIDIHTGGIDHIPVHHNNEIAQTSAIVGGTLANYWLHNAFITMKDKKMAKSENNTILLDDIKDKGLSPLSYKYLLLTAHYKRTMNFNYESLEGASITRNRMIEIYNDLKNEKAVADNSFKESVLNALYDDLDTPKVLGILWEVLRDDGAKNGVKKYAIEFCDNLLSLGIVDNPPISVPSEVNQLVKEREEKRKKRDFDGADKLRQKIQSFGFDIKDTKKGPVIVPYGKK
ncbi:MAG: cysteine--tRNA ligase [Candidatus Campbellbacteria bacterium]|nr:cysteine--tRNA ligase [Candidatus Campbellbacteria bacterium]